MFWNLAVIFNFDFLVIVVTRSLQQEAGPNQDQSMKDLESGIPITECLRILGIHHSRHNYEVQQKA